MLSGPVNAGDSILAAQYNNLRADAYGGAMLLPHQQSSPNMTLKIEAGVCYIGGVQVIVAGGNSPSFTAPTANPRIDILTIDSAGTLAITQGAENASPVAPAYPVNKIVLCEVYNRVSETALYDSDQGGSTGYIKKDVRPIVQLGGYIASSAQIAAGALTGDKFANLADIPSGAGLIPVANLPPLVSFFGDGSDGVVTISGNTTLTRDMYYSTLTINGGVTLNTNGYRVFVSGTLTNNGTIANNGSSASGTRLGAAGAPAGSLAGGSNGGNGGSTNGNDSASFGGGAGGGGGVVAIYAYNLVNNGTIQANGGNGANGNEAGGIVTVSNGVNGVNQTFGKGNRGGAGGTYDGSSGSGASGTNSSPSTPDSAWRALPQAYSIFDFFNAAAIKGGTGGGGGGCTNSGSNHCGGGGGGGGGFVLIVYHTGSFATEQASGGTKGNKGTSPATDGANGSAGTVIKVAV